MLFMSKLENILRVSRLHHECYEAGKVRNEKVDRTGVIRTLDNRKFWRGQINELSAERVGLAFKKLQRELLTGDCHE